MNRRKMKHVLWMLLGCSPTLHSSDRNQLILHPIFLPANSKLEMSERCRMMHCWQRTSATTLSTLPGPYYPVALGRKREAPCVKEQKLDQHESTWINGFVDVPISFSLRIKSPCPEASREDYALTRPVASCHLWPKGSTWLNIGLELLGSTWIHSPWRTTIGP